VLVIEGRNKKPGLVWVGREEKTQKEFKAKFEKKQKGGGFFGQGGEKEGEGEIGQRGVKSFREKTIKLKSISQGRHQ